MIRALLGMLTKNKYMDKLAQDAKQAALKMQTLTTSEKNSILDAIHNNLLSNKSEILAQNQLDLDIQKDLISKQFLSRLDLSKKYDTLLQGIKDVVKLQDPNSKILMSRELDTGLELYKVSCPVGVILIIFESRPEVVVQISSLAIKSGNAVILKGGKEARNSNLILYASIKRGLEKIDPLLGNAVQLVTERDEISSLLRLDDYINLVIPRGSNQLVKYVQQNTSIPVIGHSDGICSVYLDDDLNQDIAVKVVVDGKINYPAACNATETVLIHSGSLHLLLSLIEELVLNGVEVRLDPLLMDKVPKCLKITKATEVDYKTEFLELIIAIKLVNSMEDAINHINQFGSHHTDCIVTNSSENCREFMKRVDSANVYKNCSTRFADGFRYGFGAEIGVSTNKTHARGPVGLEGLMIYKYQLFGNGHIVADYKDKPFTHRDLPI